MGRMAEKKPKSAPKSPRKYTHHKSLEQWSGPAHVTKTGRIMPISPGRPRKQIDPKQLYQLARHGHTKEEAAAIIGLNIKSLYARLAEDPSLIAEWDRGKADLAGRIRRKQISKALGGKGDTVMLIWAGKQYCGQSDNVAQVKLTGHDGGPVRFVAEWADNSVIRREIPEGEVVDGEALEDTSEDAEWSEAEDDDDS